MLRLHHILLPALALLFLIIYQVSLADLYRYEGMMPIEIANPDFWIVFVLSMFAIFLVFPARIERPSDFFLFFYLLTSCLWGTVIWQSTRLIDVSQVPLYMLLLLLPVVGVIVIRALLSGPASRVIQPIQIASSRNLHLVLIAFIALGALAAVMTVGTGSFDLSQVYVRRLDAREAFQGQALAGYVVNMATNGMLPILAFIAGYRKSATLLGISLGFVALMFFLVGLKSPAINVVALFSLGFAFRSDWLRTNIVPLGLIAVIGIYGAALVEIYAANNTFLADYLVRRISMVQVQVQSYYFDYWLHRDSLDVFVATSPKPVPDVTFAIGYLYLHNPETNANTNAFFYALGVGGIVSYAISVIGVGLLMLIMDVFAAKTRSAAFFALAALFAALVAEQAWTTVLVTSGIALCLVLIMLFSYPSRRTAAAAS